jgi:hypothetical protein
MTMTGSWSRWFAVGIVASTIAVGAPPHVSAQQPTTSVETPLAAKPEDKGPRLLLDSRVVDVSMAYPPTLVILSSLKPLFFNGLKNELRFLDNAGA